MGSGVLQKPSRSLFLSCASAVISITAKVILLALYSQGEHRWWTFTWSLATAQTMTPPPTAVAAQKEIRPSETAQTMNIYMVSDGHAGRSRQYGLQWQYNPWTSTWLQVSEQTTTIHTAFSGNARHEHQHRALLQQDLGPRCGPQWSATFLITFRIMRLVVALLTVCWILPQKSFIKIFTISHRLASMPV